MSTDQVSKEWLTQNGHKLKIVYSYAVVNKLNIKSKEDVFKILKAVDPDDANEELAGIYTKMLQLFRNKFRKTIEKNLDR